MPSVGTARIEDTQTRSKLDSAARQLKAIVTIRHVDVGKEKDDSFVFF
jgi:hypothetical protein